jgi:hypothetical protein
MGVDLQKRPPVQRPPVQPITFIFDPSYCADGDDASGGSYSQSLFGLPVSCVVTAKWVRGQAVLPLQTTVTIMSLAPGRASVWVTNDESSETRCVAEVLGPDAEVLAVACRRAQSGLIATIVSLDESEGDPEVRMQIDGL